MQLEQYFDLHNYKEIEQFVRKVGEMATNRNRRLLKSWQFTTLISLLLFGSFVVFALSGNWRWLGGVITVFSALSIVFVSRLVYQGLSVHNAINEWITDSEKNDFKSCLEMGRDYANDLGCIKSQLGAVFWYERAAEKGSAEAKRILALFLLCSPRITYPIYPANGFGAFNDYGVWLLEQAAEGGDVDAMFEIARRVFRADDSSQIRLPDHAQGFCEKAAGLGHREAAQIISELETRTLMEEEKAENEREHPKHWKVDRIYAAIKSKNQSIVAKIASPGVHLPWRLSAIEELQDEILLREFALRDERIEVRIGAGKKLTDQREFLSCLIEWAKDKFYNRLKDITPYPGKKPAMKGRLIASGSGDKFVLWTWISKRLKEDGPTAICEFASSLD
jgi:hypothetical protein